MPSSTTANYLYNRELNHLLKGQSWNPPTTIYVALFTTVPQLDGSSGVEVSKTGTNYSRVGVAQNAGWQGPSGSNQEYSNVADIVFGVPSGTWGNVVGLGLYDAEDGGNLLFTAYLNTPKAVTSGDGAPKILAGQLRISRATC